MPQPAVPVNDIAVIKLGGSVLTDLDAYPRCADRLQRWIVHHPDERTVVVVSAEFGTTDQLLGLAESVCPSPDPAALDLLWSTGELRSVALLTLCLRRRGVNAIGLNVHQCGLHATNGAPDADHVAIDAHPLRRHLGRHRVVVVPGFLARAPGNAVVSLGRGASDLTAVLLARALHANRCELVKDVPGYFTKDPNRFGDARPLARLSYGEALRMAEDGCDLVQVAALRAARTHRCPLVVRSLNPDDHATAVGDAAPAAIDGPDLPVAAAPR